ncbi:Plasmodium vivax Vir protein, putative [Plasmodium vivax]|uniref:Vir protein, putative n=1 Tax=Plasmodium vivax TaxID=5855 RepID=A0A1G4E8U6_PLAVI|nr:Plasmodium vivax Vir protein, putative [Plasmodium vivax]
MTTRSGSTTFSDLFNSSKKELFSEQFYDAMDNDFSNLNTYENICNEKLFSRKKPQMMPICKKYLRFLDNSEVWGGTGTEYDVSLLLNYWLYHNISAIYGITNFEKISDDFSALQLVGYYFKDDPKYGQNYEKFKPNINIFKEKDWEKRKELYEYYVNYDTLFWTAQSFNNKCEEYYGFNFLHASTHPLVPGFASSVEATKIA